MKLKVVDGTEKFKELIENQLIGIHCLTKEQANEYCAVMDAIGKRWGWYYSYLERSNWNVCEAKTCYNPRQNGYSPIDFYEEEGKKLGSRFFGITVVEWEQVKSYCGLIIEEEVVEMTLEQICEALGKNIKIVKEK